MRVVSLLLVMSGVAHADVIDEKGIRVGGVFTGLQYESPSMEADGGSRPELGFAIGSFIALRATPWFAVQLEVQLAQQRFELHTNMETDIGHAKAWVVELPALARFDTLPGDRTKLYFIAGPSLVLSAGGEIDLDAGGTTAMDEIEAVNVAVAAGAGVQWTAGPGRIAIDARYRRLLGHFASSAPFFGDPDGETGQAHMLELFVGYAFP